MGTPCNIIVRTNSESPGYLMSYINFDGYPSYVGRLLLSHYNDHRRALVLVNLGWLSSLDENPEPINQEIPHSYDHPQKGVCIAYHRDRGESWKEVAPKLYVGEEALETALRHTDGSYVYVFDEGEWLFHGILYSDDEDEYEFSGDSLQEVMENSEKEGYLLE